VGGRVVLPVLLAVGFLVGLGTAVVIGVQSPAEAPALAADRPAPAPPPTEPTCAGASLEQRAGQVLIVGLPGVLAPGDRLVAEVREVGVGGVFLTKANVENEWQVRELVRGLRGGARHGLLVVTDEEPGRVSSFGALLGRTSSARTLAARGDPADVRRFARDLGQSLAELGIDANLAPVVDVDDGPARGVIGDRSFSRDPERAAEYGLAFSAGLAAAGVLPTAKHFPGHGRSDVDSHWRLGVVDASLDELEASDLLPFAAQINAGVPLVMVGHVAYTALDPDLPASLAPPAYALLRRMGFDGVAITDSTGMGAVHRTWDFPSSAVMAVAAGADAVLATDGNHARAMRDALVEAVETGRVDADRLDEAAARVLALKGEDPMPVVCRGAEGPPVFGRGRRPEH